VSPPDDARRVGLKDVAALAGVSPKTVSNVVNGYVHVSQDTRARVQHALDELNYRPNVSARNLRYGRTGLIALVVPELDLPYFAELARSVIKAAEPHGWTVLIDQTDGLPEREQLALDGIRGHLLDGLIFSPIATGAEELARRRDGTPLVLLGERVSDGPLDHVAIDNVAAATEATAHLVASGRRRIAAVGVQESAVARTAHLRLSGYREALDAAGVAEDPALLVPAAAYHRSDGAQAVHRLLEDGHRPDALFCFNDLLALGALRALRERGVRVPDDVAVVGWDDIEDGRYSTPSLSTIRPDKAQIADMAVQLLAARLGIGARNPPKETVAGHELVVRESSASP
jgi:DNA-binding LacI/PurR family transcriptional regulator